jgi:23S rRNA (guanosine2251-2'-O)-methyltransferase
MVNYKEEIAKDILKSHNVKDEYKELQVETRKRIQSHDERPFAVGLLNVTGELNVGTIIRTAALFGAENIFIFGRKEVDNRSHVGAINYVNIEFVPCMNDKLEFDTSIIRKILEKNNYWPYFVEQNGTPVNQVNFNIPAPNKVCLIFGNEGRGIPKKVLDMTFLAPISIPQLGVMRSHNVSVAAGIVMWEMCKQKGWI